MEQCRYFPIDNTLSSEMIGDFDSFGKHGHFMQLGISNEQTMAYVRDKQTGRIVETLPEFVKLIESPLEVLEDEVVGIMRIYVAKKKHDEVEVEIKKVFNKYK